MMTVLKNTLSEVLKKIKDFDFASLKKNHKVHVFIFTLLSIHLFVIIPAIFNNAFLDNFLAGAVFIYTCFHIKNFKFDFKFSKENVIFIILNAYATFAIFGFDLFLIPLYRNQRLMNIIVFMLGFIWTSYVLKSFLNWVNLLADRKDKVCSPSKNGYLKKWLILFGIMSMIFMIWQRAFSPAIMSNDSFNYISSSYLVGRSFLYVFINNIILKIAPAKPGVGVQLIVIAQILSFSCLLSTVLMYFHKRWIKFKWIVVTAIVLPLIPSLGLHAVTIWADLMVGMCMLWVAYTTVRVIDEIVINNTASKNEQASLYIQLCVSLIFMYFGKANTTIVYLAAVLSLGILFILKKQWKLLLTVGLSAVLVLLIRYPGHAVLGAERWGHLDAHKYYAGIHDMQATYYNGGNFSEKKLALLKHYIPNIDDLMEKFTPDDVKYADWDNRQELIDEMTDKEFVSMYADTFIKNPWKMFRSMLHRNRLYWDIDAKRQIGCVNITGVTIPVRGYAATEEYIKLGTEIASYQHQGTLTDIMRSYMRTMNAPVFTTFVWRIGIWTALILISITTLIYKKRTIWIVTYIPVFVYFVTLLLTNGWTDYRYGLPIFFVGMFAPTALLLLTPSEREFFE